MPDKSLLTAVAILPSPEVTGPIQTIRKQYDRHIGRWMPHLNLVFPFRPAESFAEAMPLVEQVCAAAAPFDISLERFRFFQHSPRSFTLWLAPEPAEPIAVLQRAFLEAFPDCDEVSRFQGGFTPHVSVGQAPGSEMKDRLLEQFQADWTPLKFKASEVAVLAREEMGPFRVVQSFPLGG